MKLNVSKTPCGIGDGDENESLKAIVTLINGNCNVGEIVLIAMKFTPYLNFIKHCFSFQDTIGTVTYN